MSSWLWKYSVTNSKKIVECSKIGKMNNLKNPDESDVVFLHGQFLLCIFSAKNLPDMDSWIAKLYDKNDVTDPFVDVWLGNARLVKSSIIFNDLNPEWNESYRLFFIRNTHSCINYSCNKITKTWIKFSRQNWNGLFK